MVGSVGTRCVVCHSKVQLQKIMLVGSVHDVVSDTVNTCGSYRNQQKTHGRQQQHLVVAWDLEGDNVNDMNTAIRSYWYYHDITVLTFNYISRC